MGTQRKSIKVFAPATVANVVCGFDVLGFAVNAPGDMVIMTLTDQPGVRINAIHGDDGRLPKAAEKNTVSAVVIHYLQHIGAHQQGVEIELFKQMPIGSGLGSSAASTVAGLFAINELMGRPLTKQALLPFALQGELLACGQGHADNVAPALLGGFVLIRSYDPLDVISLHTPAPLWCALVYPHIEIQTRDARRIIKRQVSLKDTVTQMGNIAGFVAGLYQEDHQLLARSMQDVIIEPTRSVLIPDFDKLKALSLGAGALGFGISGSGPSVFALCKEKELAKQICDAVGQQFWQSGIQSDLFVSSINPNGPKIID